MPLFRMTALMPNSNRSAALASARLKSQFKEPRTRVDGASDNGNELRGVRIGNERSLRAADLCAERCTTL
jgi:hypothetical protein